MSQPIVARGVRVHNLKGVNVTIPTGKLVVVTGVSGSGKSSLAFDTLYVEGRRRYVESLSVYARQFLERLEKPDADALEGLCPAVAIRQRSPGRSPRSTLATATEIHDHLRLLFARLGKTICGSCGEEVSKDTPQSAAERLLGLPSGTQVLVGFAFDPGGMRAEDARERLERSGFRRVLVGDEVRDLESLQAGLSPPGPWFVVVDRLRALPETRARLVESLEQAFVEGAGRALVHSGTGLRLTFSESFDCPRCGRVYEEPQPHRLSFNTPQGACPTCHGFGNQIEVDRELVVPDPGLSLGKGALAPWARPQYRGVMAELRRFATRRGLPWDLAWQDLSEEHRRLVLEGDDEFQGVIGFFRSLEGQKYKVQVRVFLSRYRGYRVCPACQGSRLRPEALDVKLGGLNLHQVSGLSVTAARAFLSGLGQERAAPAGASVLEELERRLSFLADLGLEYLTLDRPFASLSGGEAQRAALAMALGSGLLGMLYVLDEPSVGLHTRDVGRLLAVLKALRDQGNTVLVVEHDPALVREADWIVDLGPGAGEQGGRVVFQGTLEDLVRDGRSLTAKYLRGDLRLKSRGSRLKGRERALLVRGARARNLKNLEVRIPLGALTCVTGVSGSGKSTLVHEVIASGLMAGWGGVETPGEHAVIEGRDLIDEVVVVDQSPLGRTPRSNPVTYIKAFDAIRELFAALPEASRLGLSASDFSFNLPGGRCEACCGDGRVRVDMQFMADVYLTCDACSGRRYQPRVLGVRHKGRTIDQVLELSVQEALHFFANQPKVTRRLKLLQEIGLGYLRLGQPATALSGGEAQRIKLAAHLSRRPGERVLYVMDEPTTGLHLADVADLLDCFERLLEAGATLLVVEHNLEMVRRADWVVDLGPGGGEAGGRLLFQGGPSALAASGVSPTGQCLRETQLVAFGS
jgi:excinuclease ABC subunit A